MSSDPNQDFFNSFFAKFSSSAGGMAEGPDGLVSQSLDFSRGANEERMDKTASELHRILKQYLKGDPNAKSISRSILSQGGEVLDRLGGRDASLMQDAQAREIAEVIVATDGSRPTFLINDGEVDTASSILGSWGQFLTDHEAQLKQAIECVGRIDHPGTSVGYAGTGFLIHRNVVITNRHVLQAIAKWSNNQWVLAPNIAIDFGHEWQATASKNRRLVNSVAFAAAPEINPYALDHKKLDLAVLELQPTDNDVPFLRLNLSDAWNLTGANVVTIGYPGPPPAITFPPNLLDQLFQSHFGFKRLAPGLVRIPQIAQRPDWTLAHDATTLGGNSGSVVIAIGYDGMASGLHYGGKWNEPRENWGHILADTLQVLDIKTQRTLKQTLLDLGVQLDSNQPSAAPSSPAVASAPVAPPPAPISLTSTPTPSNVHTGSPRTSSEPSTSSTRKTTDVTNGATRAPVVPMGARVPLSSMQFLGIRAGASRAEATELEAPGDGQTPAQAFEGRSGYDPTFIPGSNIPIPEPSGDTRTLRRGGTGNVLKYEHFSVIMSASRKLPIITATNIDGGQSRQMPRIDQWSYDGRLDQADQIGNELYKRNDLDRGHMVRREDPVWGDFATAKRANVDTFHYTNSCPQMAAVNQRVWLGLEDYILSHTRQDRMRVSVFTGPFFTDDDPVYRGVAIPQAFWKVIVFLLDDGRLSATAYKVSQAEELQNLEFVFAGYKTFQISIQQVADLTGINFSLLIPLDGFSTHEFIHGGRLQERLEEFSQIRV